MSRKGLNIYKRKDGRWEARYIKSRNALGKPKYGYLYASSYREVRCDLQHTLQLQGKPSGSEERTRNSTFELVSMEWLDAFSINFKESTYIRYRTLIECYLMPSFQTVKIEKITKEMVRKLCKHLELHGKKDKTGLSPKTISDVLSVLRRILNYAGTIGISVDSKVLDLVAMYRAIRDTNRLAEAYERSRQKRTEVHDNPNTKPPPPCMRGRLSGLTGSLAGRSFELIPGRSVELGRNPAEVSLIVRGEKISRIHCTVQYNGKDLGFNVTDHSRNGVFVNGVRIPYNVPTYVSGKSIVALADGANKFQLIEAADEDDRSPALGADNAVETTQSRELKYYSRQSVANLYNVAAEAYYELENYESAAMMYQKAIGYSPDILSYYQGEATALIQLGDYSGADEVLAEMAKAVPDAEQSGAYQVVQSELLRKQGDLPDALDAARKAIGSADGNDQLARAYRLAASICEDIGDSMLSEEINLLNQGIEQLPDGYYNALAGQLASAYIRQAEATGNPSYQKDALRIYQQLEKNGNTTLEVRLNIAMLQYQLHDFSKAMEMLQALKDDYPKDYRVYKWLAFVQGELDLQNGASYTKTLGYYETAAELYRAEQASGVYDPQMDELDRMARNNWQ